MIKVNVWHTGNGLYIADHPEATKNLCIKITDLGNRGVLNGNISLFGLEICIFINVKSRIMLNCKAIKD